MKALPSFYNKKMNSEKNPVFLCGNGNENYANILKFRWSKTNH